MILSNMPPTQQVDRDPFMIVILCDDNPPKYPRRFNRLQRLSSALTRKTPPILNHCHVTKRLLTDRAFPHAGATYDAIEGRFRIIKRDAAKLRAEVESGSRPEAPARGFFNATGSPVSTPKKNNKNRGTTADSFSVPSTPQSNGSARNGNKVMNGRVSKVNASPVSRKKKNATSTYSPVKAEGENGIVVLDDDEIDNTIMLDNSFYSTGGSGTEFGTGTAQSSMSGGRSGASGHDGSGSIVVGANSDMDAWPAMDDFFPDFDEDQNGC